MSFSFEDVDYIDLYKWLWSRHHSQMLGFNNLVSAVDTYCIKFNDVLIDDHVGTQIVMTLIEIGFIVKKHDDVDQDIEHGRVYHLKSVTQYL